MYTGATGTGLQYAPRIRRPVSEHRFAVEGFWFQVPFLLLSPTGAELARFFPEGWVDPPTRLEMGKETSRDPRRSRRIRHWDSLALGPAP